MRTTTSPAVPVTAVILASSRRPAAAGSKLQVQVLLPRTSGSSGSKALHCCSGPSRLRPTMLSSDMPSRAAASEAVARAVHGLGAAL
jgi:hypothetical protein